MAGYKILFNTRHAYVLQVLSVVTFRITGQYFFFFTIVKLWPTVMYT